MISLRNVTKRFGPLSAVDRLTLEVERGEVFGLVGPDGAGKTTVLRMLAGLVDASEGSITVDGHDVAKEANAIKDRIGYMAQRFALYGDLTVAENMGFYADLFGVSSSERRALTPSLLSMTRMAPFVDRPAAKLSGGMKQKLALMCTLLHKPAVLLLDEPTNGVDPVSRRDFWGILKGLVEGGMTLFLTTAYMDEAERCDRVGLLDNGRLILCDTPDGLRTTIRDECYEVETVDTRAESIRIQALPHVTSIRPAGSVLHVFVEPGFAPEPAWHRIPPSLEDVFVHAVGGAG